MGASIVPRRDLGRPTTSATYSRVSARVVHELLEAPVRLRRARDDEEARRVAIEAVHDARPVRLLPALDVVGEQPVHERSLRVPGRGMHDDARGLVDDEEMLVLVRDREVHRLRRERARHRRPAPRTRRSSPPASRALFGRAVPSTRTPPSRTSRSATAREPISGSAARKRSSRSPAALSGTRSRVTRTARPVGREERAEQDRDADHDEAVGKVEGRPVAKVDEVGHVPEPDTVDEVGRRCRR